MNACSKNVWSPIYSPFIQIIADLPSCDQLPITFFVAYYDLLRNEVEFVAKSQITTKNFRTY